MIKVPLSDITIKTKDVEIPESCPNKDCGVSFTEKESSNLLEINYCDLWYRGYLYEDKELGRTFFESNSSTEGGESYVVVGYQCAQCRQDIAMGEENRS